MFVAMKRVVCLLSRKAQRKASSAARPVKVQTKIRHLRTANDHATPPTRALGFGSSTDWARCSLHTARRGLRSRCRLGFARKADSDAFALYIWAIVQHAPRVDFPERHASTAVASRSRPPGPATRTRTSSQLQTKIPSPPRVGFGAAAFRVDRALGPRTRNRS